MSGLSGNARSSASALWARARAAWEDMSGRARLGLAFLIGLLLLVGVLDLQDRGIQLRDNIADAQSSALLHFEDDAVESWAGKLELAVAARDRMQSRLWTGDTPGIIAAEIQRHIRQQEAFAEARSVRVTVNPEPLQLDSGMALRFEISASLDQGRDSVAFLSSVLSDNRILLIDEVTLSLARLTGGTLTVRGHAPLANIQADPE